MIEKKIELIKKVGIKKEEGYIYFLDSDGDISRIKGKLEDGLDVCSKERSEKIMKVGIKKDRIHSYFLNKEGDICRYFIEDDGEMEFLKVYDRFVDWELEDNPNFNEQWIQRAWLDDFYGFLKEKKCINEEQIKDITKLVKIQTKLCEINQNETNEIQNN